jgi:hypothetical protein
MSSKGPVGQLVKLRGGCLPPRGRLTTGLQVGNLPHKSTNRHSSSKRLSTRGRGAELGSHAGSVGTG